MNPRFTKRQVALAASAALGTALIGGVPVVASAGGKTSGQYAAGDFHNHTTCSDGSISMQKLVKKSTDKSDGTYGLDWFVQAGHGGTGNRNCTLVEDADLATPAYPQRSGNTPFDVPTAANPSPSQYTGPQTTWAQSIGAAGIQGNVSGSGATQNMWRWQAIQQYQYPLMEYLNAYLNRPLFMGVESVVAGHEHTSMSVITGQVPMALDHVKLPSTPGYTPIGNANGLAQWQYCFDRGNSDTSRGNTSATSGVGNNWECSVPGSLNSGAADWNAAAAKLNGANGELGHAKTVEAVKWMAAFHPQGSYYVPAHLERAGPFNPTGNNGFNIEHLRNFNNAGPTVAFGFETQPGHGASSERGEYFPARNNIGGVLVDSVGGTTYGGTGVYGAQIGGVWDALLGEGRNWWFFASSDWHNRGIFSPDDRRSTQDFLPGEYQRNYTMVRQGGDSKLRPQPIVDGLRSGNNWVASGQLIDRLAFVACEVPREVAKRTGKFVEKLGEGAVEALALVAAKKNTDDNLGNCATMGEKLVVKPGSEVIVGIAVRDPSGTNYAPYTFDNPSLAQVGIKQPLNKPVLDHVDVIGGKVSGYRTPGTPEYSGAWPNTWLTNPDMATVPAAAKNPSAALLRTFNVRGWKESDDDDRRGARDWKHRGEYKTMSFRLRDLKESQYIRLRGTNLPPNVPYETDANGNPLADIHTNATTTNVAAGEVGTLKIPCKVVGSNVPDNGVEYRGTAIDGCPNHLPTINGVRYVAYDVAAWADLWFYSNPIYIEVKGATMVAGVK